MSGVLRIIGEEFFLDEFLDVAAELCLLLGVLCVGEGGFGAFAQFQLYLRGDCRVVLDICWLIVNECGLILLLLSNMVFI